GGKRKILRYLGIEPAQHLVIGPGQQGLRNNVGVEQDHPRSVGVAGVLSRWTLSSSPPRGLARAARAEPSLRRVAGLTAPSRIARISASVLRPCRFARARSARCVSVPMFRTTIAGILAPPLSDSMISLYPK